MPASARLPLLLMLAGVFVAASDLTVVSTILPQIVFDLEIPLRTGLSQAAWIVNAYLIAYTLTLPLLGHVSDQFGRRNTFLACLVLFSAGSLVAGTARTLEVMIAGRAIQALGAGAMVPVAMAYVADVLPPERRPLALGIVGAVDTAGWVIGPLYGALMVAFSNGAGSSSSMSLSVLQRAPVCGSACAGPHRTPGRVQASWRLATD